jgi:hypothetical protein
LFDAKISLPPRATNCRHQTGCHQNTKQEMITRFQKGEPVFGSNVGMFSQHQSLNKLNDRPKCSPIWRPKSRPAQEQSQRCQKTPVTQCLRVRTKAFLQQAGESGVMDCAIPLPSNVGEEASGREGHTKYR